MVIMVAHVDHMILFLIACIKSSIKVELIVRLLLICVDDMVALLCINLWCGY